MAELDAYLVDLQDRGFTPDTHRSYASNLRRFLRFVADRGTHPHRATLADLKAFLAYLQGEGFVEETILNNFSSVSSYYEYLVMEDRLEKNPVPPFRRRYLVKLARDRESHRSNPRRQVPALDDLKRLVAYGLGARDQALILLALKTGLRRDELVRLDVEDVDLVRMWVRVHAHRKRANTKVFFDEETRAFLEAWLRQRGARKVPPTQHALFVGPGGRRLDRSGAYNAVVHAAIRAGIHDPKSRRQEERFGPHNCRHWFTSVLLNAGVPRQFVQWLRGDHAREAVDQYFHVDETELRRRYLAAMPKLGVDPPPD